MKIIKLPHGANVIIAWDGITLLQDTSSIFLRWKDWDEMMKFVEEVRKYNHLEY